MGKIKISLVKLVHLIFISRIILTEKAIKKMLVLSSLRYIVSPETMILTDKRCHKIETLENKKVNIWNGSEFSNVHIKKTSDKSELITIQFSDGELTYTNIIILS